MGVGVLGVIRTVVGWTTHRWVNLRMRPGPVAVPVFAICFIALWAYQQQNADFIINSRA